jgi:hypothetical protein
MEINRCIKMFIEISRSPLYKRGIGLDLGRKKAESIKMSVAHRGDFQSQAQDTSIMNVLCQNALQPAASGGAENPPGEAAI